MAANFFYRSGFFWEAVDIVAWFVDDLGRQLRHLRCMRKLIISWRFATIWITMGVIHIRMYVPGNKFFLRNIVLICHIRNRRIHILIVFLQLFIRKFKATIGHVVWWTRLRIIHIPLNGPTKQLCLRFNTSSDGILDRRRVIVGCFGINEVEINITTSLFTFGLGHLIQFSKFLPQLRELRMKSWSSLKVWSSWLAVGRHIQIIQISFNSTVLRKSFTKITN